MHTHLSGTVGEHLMTVFEFDFEHRVRQWFDNCPLKDDRIFFGLWQVKTPRIKTADPEGGR